MRSLISLACIAFGGTSVVLLMMVSLIDSASRALGAPVLGLKEMSEALLPVTVGASLPLAILAGRSVSIEGLVNQLPRRLGLGVTALLLASFLWGLPGRTKLGLQYFYATKAH